MKNNVITLRLFVEGNLNMQTKKAPVLDFTTTANKDPIGLVRNAQIYIVLCEKGHWRH